MYLRTHAEITQAMAERKKQSAQIRERTDAFVRKTYGIERYSALTEKYIPNRQDEGTLAVLARQIGSVCVEDIACHIGAHALGLNPITLTFTQDNFTRLNHDKYQRVKVPWIWHSKRGKFVIEGTYVAREWIMNLEGRLLSKILTKSGLFLPQFHQALRNGVLVTNNPCIDISALHAEALQLATVKPEFVYMEHRARGVRTPTKQAQEKLQTCRPPASWYYPLYLSWFLDGSKVLLETYENPIGEVHEAKRLFEHTMRQIENAVGVRPLVVEIPPLSREMLFCNRHIVENPTLVKQIGERTHANGGSTVDLFKSIAQQVIQSR